MAMAGRIAIPMSGVAALESPQPHRYVFSRAYIPARTRRQPLVVVSRASGGGTNKQRQEERNRLQMSSPPGRTSPSPVGSNSLGIREDNDQKVEERGEAEGEQGTNEESTSAASESAEEIGKALSQLRSEGIALGSQYPASTTGFWKGVAEETQLIEWPVFSKVLGTTGVVMAMIIGSSVVLLTVNAVLAAGSDYVFNDPAFRDFARTHFKLVF